jgi:hypothetical protein
MIKTAALSLILALAACTNLTGPGAGSVPGKPIPQGTGLARIRLDAGESSRTVRTILPGAGSYYFTLEFTAPGKTPVNETLSSGLTLTVALEPAVWTLEVKGYADSDMTALKATGRAGVPITAGTTSNCDVYLTPDFTSGAEGTLDYNISFPASVSRAFLALYPLDAPGTSAVQAISRELDISTSAAGTLSLPEGSYQVLVDLYDGGDNKAAVWTSVAHIDDSSTTTLTRGFDAVDFADCPPVIGTGLTTLEAKLDAALSSSSGSYTIVLDGAETDLASFTPKTLNATGNKDIVITLRGGGKTVQVKETGTPLFTLGADSGSSLTLAVQDLTLKSLNNNSADLVRIEDRGTLEMKAGSLVDNEQAVYVDGGVFTMSGGSVEAYYSGVFVNRGAFSMSGGVLRGYVDNSDVFTMSGGSVERSVWNGGTFSMSGGVLSSGIWNGDVFTMSGGSVSGYTANKGGGYSSVISAGGVYNTGTFTMSGGVISGNSLGPYSPSAYGGGVYNTGTFTLSDGLISGNSATALTDAYGGGVCNTGTFTMSGGLVSGNSTTTDSTTRSCGGGVYNTGTFTMSGGSVSDNSAASGGGVYSSEGTFTMSGGSVSGNTSSFSGGGVRNGGTFDMSGGVVSGNTSSGGVVSGITLSSSGGGVSSEGTFTMSGGSVSGNSASSGGGVRNDGTFTMSGGSVSGNTSSDGGGVYNMGTFDMSDGSVSGNAVSTSSSSSAAYSYGGGVCNTDGTFTLSGGSVSGNTVSAFSSSSTYNSAAYSYGGGVYNSGTFTMSGGSVSGNTVSASSDYYSSGFYGGGVSNTAGTFTMSGGVVSGNSASSGGGVYVRSGTFTKHLGAVIYGSNESDSALKNTAGADGDAVAVNISPVKKRNATAGTDITLNSDLIGSAGGWETVSDITYSGTWALQTDGRRQSPAISFPETTKERVSFTSAVVNADIVIQLDVSTNNYRYAAISTLDNDDATFGGYFPGSSISGTTSVTVAIPVPTPGSHFIEIYYSTANASNDSGSGSNCGWFKVIE